MNNQKPVHGGKRTNSGRKLKPDKKATMTMRVSPVIMERLKQLPRGKRNAFIECAIVKALDELEAMK